jgi:hypothetical protein
MFRLIKRVDWQKSNAHQLLLSKFLKPRKPEDFDNDSWKNVLGDFSKNAIERFAKEGFLEEADLLVTLLAKKWGAELKDMLRQRGLPVSSRKDEMVQRLVDADSDGMKKIAAGSKVFVCTQKGKELAEQYLAIEEKKREMVEQGLLEYIKGREFKKASLIVAAYETEQVFPRGMGIDWEHPHPEREIELLNTIFNSKPKILAKLGNEKLEDLRIGAAMMLLWGKNDAREWLPPNFETGLSLDANVTARMFFFYALHQHSLKQIRDSGIVDSVVIFNNNSDSCDACKKMSKRIYKLGEVPEFPYEHCTNEMGCRCLPMGNYK